MNFIVNKDKEIFKKLFLLIVNLNNKVRMYILVLFILGIIIDIFVNPRISDLIVFFLIILWIINIFNFRIKQTYALIIATVCYGIAFFFQFFDEDMIAEKAVSWFFVFLGIALIQSLFRGFNKNESKD